MYIIATLLLIIGALSGAIYGFVLEMPCLKIILYCFAGGFAGSAAGGLVFTYLYFTAPNDMDMDEILLPPPSKKVKWARLKTLVSMPESDRKRIKRLEKEIQETNNKRRS